MDEQREPDRISVRPDLIIIGLREHVSNLGKQNEELMYENIKLHALLKQMTMDTPTDEDGGSKDA